MINEVLLEKIDLLLDKRFKKVDRQFYSIHKRLNSVEKEIAALRKQQNQDRQDLIGFFHEAGLFFDEMRENLSTRLSRIEDHLELVKN